MGTQSNEKDRRQLVSSAGIGKRQEQRSCAGRRRGISSAYLARRCEKLRQDGQRDGGDGG